jgi:hypothetical protein
MKSVRVSLARRVAIACMLCVAWLSVSAIGVNSANALTFAFTPGPGLGMSPPMELLSAVTAAGGLWSSKFSDPITVHISIAGFTSPGPVLGYFDVDGAGAVDYFAYDMVKPKLSADATTMADASAVASLQSGPYLHMVTNDTTMTGAPRMSVTSGFVYNSILRLTSANQKSLGLKPGMAGGAGSDGTIYLNTTHFGSYDFDPSDGIEMGKTDAVAVIAHELAHALGFISGVDHVDYAASLMPSASVTMDKIFTTLDLYRYSGDSIGKDDPPTTGETLDWAFGAVLGDNPYFSIDGGATSLGKFATGVSDDGDQAQHWKDESLVLPPPLGLMDPDIGPGELGIVTTLDLTALDVIGYDLVPVPEPGSIFLFAVGGVLLWLGRPRT